MVCYMDIMCNKVMKRILSSGTGLICKEKKTKLHCGRHVKEITQYPVCIEIYRIGHIKIVFIGETRYSFFFFLLW